MVLSLRECFSQVEAEVVSNSRNQIHQTWGTFLQLLTIFERILATSLYTTHCIQWCTGVLMSCLVPFGYHACESFCEIVIIMKESYLNKRAIAQWSRRRANN